MNAHPRNVTPHWGEPADPLAAAPCEAAWAENRRRFFTGGAKAGGAAAVSVADAAGAQTHSAKAR